MNVEGPQAENRLRPFAVPGAGGQWMRGVF